MKRFTLKQIILIVGLIVFSALAVTVGNIAKAGNVLSIIRPVNAVINQEDDKRILKSFYKDEPFEVTDLKVKKFRLKLNSAFSTSRLSAQSNTNPDDWLEDLEFAIKNKSEKKIIYIGIHLDFPETRNSGKLLVWTINLGQYPLDKQPKGDPISINPGESAHYQLTSADFGKLKRYLEKGGSNLKILNKAELNMRMIGFSDGTMWELGDYYKIETINGRQGLIKIEK